MRTSDLTGALLDFWTARAEGVPAADLELRANGTLCVRRLRNGPHGIDGVMVLDYSTNWALAGPLVGKHFVEVFCNRDPRVWSGFITRFKPTIHSVQENGPTAMIAICRAVVRAAFGDEVEDLP